MNNTISFEQSVERWVHSCSNTNTPSQVDTSAAHDVARAIQTSGKHRSSLQSIVISSGGMDSLYKMLAWIGDPDASEILVGKTFFLLNQMATKSNTETRLEFVRHGIISHGVFHLMNPSSQSRHGLILSTFSTIAAGLYQREHADVNIEFMKSIDLFLSFVDQYSGASRLIGNLAYHGPNQDPMLQAGALQYIKQSLNAKNDSARIASVFTWALLVGSMPDDDKGHGHPDLEIPPDCIDIILQGLRYSLDGKSMANTYYRPAKVLIALAKLCANDTNKGKIVEKGGVQLLSRVIDVKEEQGSFVIVNALQCLWLLSYDETGRIAIKSTCFERIMALGSSDEMEVSTSAQGCILIVNQSMRQNANSDKEDNVEEQEVEEEEEAQQEEEQEDPVSNSEVKPSQKKMRKKKKKPTPPPAPLGANTKKQQLRVMLSYQWDSQDTVLRIRHALKEHGIDVWIDVEQMKGNIIDCMSRAVETSDIICMCPSQRYAESPNCRLEAEYASSCRKVIMPFMMQRDYRPSGWLGLIMGQKLWYKFFDVEEMEFQTTMKRIINDMYAGPSDLVVPREQQEQSLEKIITPKGVLDPRSSDDQLIKTPKQREMLKNEIKEELKAELRQELKDELKKEILREVMQELGSTSSSRVVPKEIITERGNSTIRSKSSWFRGLRK